MRGVFMKKITLNIFIFLMLLFSIPSLPKAYNPSEAIKPEVLSVHFNEQGKLLKYGDRLHITLTLSNADYVFSNFIFSSKFGTIPVSFDTPIQKGNVYVYKGESDILTSKLPENSYTFDNSPLFVRDLYGNSQLIYIFESYTFTFCNDCYYGRHRGGTATPSKQAVCSICETPYGDYAKGVTLNATKTTLQAGKSSTALKIEEKNPSDKAKKWTSSNPKVVSVHKKTGKLTAKKTGKTTITVTMKSGATAKCKVTVKKSADKTKKLMIANVPKLKVGQKYQLIVRRNPVTATEKLTYEALGKDSGVSVNKRGLVKAKRKGRYIVEVKSSNGKRAKVRVNVF